MWTFLFESLSDISDMSVGNFFVVFTHRCPRGSKSGGVTSTLSPSFSPEIISILAPSVTPSCTSTSVILLFSFVSALFLFVYTTCYYVHGRVNTSFLVVPVSTSVACIPDLTSILLSIRHNKVSVLVEPVFVSEGVVAVLTGEVFVEPVFVSGVLLSDAEAGGTTAKQLFGPCPLTI